MLYNQEIKHKFLEGSDKNIVNSYSRIFKRSKELEERLNKDLFDFDISELELVIDRLNFTSANYAEGDLSRIKKYINWCIDEKYTKRPFNPIKRYATPQKDWVAPLVKNGNDGYLNKSQIEKIENHKSVNRQDAIVILLTFEGLTYEEMRNLKVHDVNFETGVLNLHEVNGYRSITVSNSTLQVINDAIYEKKYIKHVDEDVYVKATSFNYKPSDYVVKNIASAKNIQVTKPVVDDRIRAVKKHLDLENFSSLTIRKSGEIYMVYENLNKFDDIGSKIEMQQTAYKIVTKRFKMDEKQYPIELAKFATI